MKHFLTVFCGTFFLGIMISLFTNSAVENVKTPLVCFGVMLVVIGIGVLFDTVGVAVAVADVAPFNARAARKARGAKISLKLIRKADVVANICCDVVGDICGIVSGALAATIALLLVADGNILVASVMAGLASAFTVGGKAVMKGVAIREAHRIMEIVGIILDYRNWFPGKKERGEH